MPLTSGYAAMKAGARLVPFQWERRDPGPHDIVIDIQYCGICHSDIHQARDEWGGGMFPMVPGHEIAGRVSRVGANVQRFTVGQPAGVGCYVDSCRTCAACRDGEEQYCENGPVFTYSSLEKDGKTPTYGGYSKQIVVDEAFALTLPGTLALEQAAPLLCAGITTYSPLRHWNVGPGQRVAVVGLGGLGHMGVKLAKALDAEVTVLSTSPKKKSDALRLGADAFEVTKDKAALGRLAKRFDFILDTVSAQHPISDYLELLKRNGALVLVGAPPEAVPVQAFSLIMGRRALAGSLIGGLRETQEMLDFCGAKKIGADVEVIPAQAINDAYDRTVNGDVRFRFVIDAGTM